MTSLSVTSEFREEFEAERTSWLRRRFLWYSGILGVLGLVNLATAVGAFFILVPPSGFLAGVGVIATSLGAMMIFLGPFIYVKGHATRFDRDQLLRFVTVMIVAAGLLNLVEIPIAGVVGRSIDQHEFFADDEPETVSTGPATGDAEPAEAGDTKSGALRVTASGPIGSRDGPEVLDAPLGVIWSWLGNLLAIHLIASLFIPWTPREAYRPLWPLIGCGAVFTLAYGVLVRDAPPLVAALTVLALPAVGLPGAAFAWWRTSRFRASFSHRMLRGAYGEMKRELVDARRIHESLFPPELPEGAVTMRYRYEPMRQIGGDFLFARRVPTDDGHPLLDVTILDVTGHGITAALTVNRLAGEIERQLGEDPQSGPGELLRGLNAYLHHTLAIHSVYATAICIRVDPNEGDVRWASAGHPPAFLRTVAGRLDRLESTTFLLGACRGDDFVPNEQRQAFGPGDRLLAYTDGATEARNADGRMLRVDGMQKLVVSIPPPERESGEWSAELLRAVDDFRHGPVQDDTLIVEIARPL
jgi:serine phosphatase RsbU (regulator of sigma subunit)